MVRAVQQGGASTEASSDSAGETEVELVEATVARGTVIANDEPHRVGSIVRLPEAEVKRLRKLGVLVDPDQPVVPRSTAGAVYRQKK